MRFSRRTLLAALACATALPTAPKAAASELESDIFNPANSRNFDQLVVAAQEPVLLYIWAPWCGVCTRTTPEIERAGRALRENVTFATLNYDQNTYLAKRMGIRAVPTLILFQQGRERARRTGRVDSDTLRNWVEARL